MRAARPRWRRRCPASIEELIDGGEHRASRAGPRVGTGRVAGRPGSPSAVDARPSRRGAVVLELVGAAADGRPAGSPARSRGRGRRPPGMRAPAKRSHRGTAGGDAPRVRNRLGGRPGRPPAPARRRQPTSPIVPASAGGDPGRRASRGSSATAAARLRRGEVDLLGSGRSRAWPRRRRVVRRGRPPAWRAHAARQDRCDLPRGERPSATAGRCRARAPRCRPRAA